MIACPACGAENPVQAKFCMACGAQLAASPVAREERKTVTTLFCDLVAFTAMSEAADPEDVDALLGRYHEAARVVIESHGGTVEKFIGDAVVGVFGVPAVHEDDPERAVRAALRILAAMEGMVRPDGTPLEARCGVNTGEALVRLDVDPASGRGFLTGDAVNTAARLEAAAPPMGVVVGALTHALTASAFAYGALAELSLKGKTGRVEAWLAREEPAGHAPRGAGMPARAMVGRRPELARCETALARLSEGEGGLLLVTGEAGIGKTRLMDEVRTEAESQGFAWLQGHTLSFGRSISYWPFLEILQQDAGIESDDDEAARSLKLAARLGALLADQTPEVLPYLASLLSLPVPAELAERVSYLDSEAMGRQLYRASRLYFTRLAQERPLVLVFEDVHWLDGSSASLLEHLLPLTAQLPLLVSCVARPELDSAITRLRELAQTDYAERSIEIALAPLSSAESTKLASQLINGTDLPVPLRQAILAKAEGNPFFVEEIIQSLIDLGGLVRERASGAYRVTDEAGRITIPDTLLGVIMARVDRLDDDLKQVLRLASVIGRSFFYRLLAAIAEAERELDDSLAGLQARDLVLEKARDPELEYIFKHALVQEATYESIAKRRRRELHRQVAASIESLFAERLEDFLGLLAYHYTRAEDWEKAQEYLFKAADQAGTIAADAEALEHYEQAMDAYTLAFGEKWDPMERAAVEHKIGDALYRRGEHERARGHLFSALTLLGRPFPRRTGAVRRAITVQMLVQLGHRLVPFVRRSASDRSNRTVEERFWIYHSLTFMDAGADQSQLLLALLLALNDVERAALDWPTAAAFAGVGYVCDFVPLRRISRYYHRKALRLAERAGDPFALATVHWLMGFHEYWATGSWSQASDYDLRAADEFEALGRFREWGTSMIEAVNVMVDEGRLPEALLLCEQITSRAEEAGDPVVAGWARCRLGNISSIEGEHGQAEKALLSGIELLLRALQPADAVSGFGWLALSLLRQGRTDEAQAVLDEQSDRIRRFGIAGHFLRGYHTAQAMLSLKNAERAHGEARDVALDEARAACQTLRKIAKADICATVAACRMQGTYEWLRGRRGKAKSLWAKSRALADRLGARYEGALSDLESGRLTGDAAALERAAATFEAIGARPDLARARELLGGLRQGRSAAPG